LKGSVYERQVDNVLTGGWNLLPPGDLIGPADALQLENFRVTSAGALRQRLGHGPPIFNTGAVRQFCEVKGPTPRRYSATYLGGLWRNATNLGTFGFGFGNRIGMVSYKGLLWAMSHTAQKRDDGTTLLPWTIPGPAAPPTLVPTLGGGGFGLVLDQVYTYWTTYVDAYGLESVSSPTGADTAPIAVPNQIITILSPPASLGAVGWNVYRSGNTLQDTLRLNVAPYAIGANFVDNGDAASNLDDLSITDLDIALEANDAPPPAGSGLAGPFYEHLLAWGVRYDPTHPERGGPNRLFWSALLRPQSWPGAELDEGNHADLGELGEEIVGVTIRPRVASIFKDSSIWRLVGDPDDPNSEIERVTGAVGALSPPISVGSKDYFQGKEGLYEYNGEVATKITGKLDRLFLGEQPEDAGFAFSTAVALNQDPGFREYNRLGHRNGRLYFFYCATGAELPNRGITCELGADNWGSDSRGVTALLDEGQNGLLLGCVSTAGSAVYSMEEGPTDSGRGIYCAYHSGYKDQGHPDNLKTYADVVIEHNTQGALMTVAAFYNGGTGPAPTKLLASSEALGTFSSTNRTVSTFKLAFASDQLGIQARNIAIRIDGGDAGGGPVTLYKVFVHYFIEPRNSATYDSDETDLGTQNVKAVDEAEIDIDYPDAGGGPITLAVAGDRPGPGFTTFVATVDPTIGRQVLRIPVVPTLEGRLLRVTALAPTGSTFRLYGVRLRILPFGEYIDNTRGEIFLTLPINVGLN